MVNKLYRLFSYKQKFEILFINITTNTPLLCNTLYTLKYHVCLASGCIFINVLLNITLLDLFLFFYW